VDDMGRREGRLVEDMVEVVREGVYGANFSKIRRNKWKQRWFQKKSHICRSRAEKISQIPRER
jgi:hypothetical protein